MRPDRQYRARLASALAAMATEYGEAVAADNQDFAAAHARANMTLFSLMAGRSDKEQLMLACFLIRTIYLRATIQNTIGIADDLLHLHISDKSIKHHDQLMRWRQDAIDRITGRGAGR